MNRTLILLLVVAGLGAIVYFNLEDQDKPISSVVGADRDFAVPRDQIYKIFIANRNGSTSTIERKGDSNSWTYNGEYRARPDAVDNLLLAVEKIRMRFKPTDAAKPNLIKSLATQGLKVEIYGKGGENLKTYYLGGATNDELGTYVIMEGSEQPYVADIPAWQGNILFRYNLAGDDWRDRSVFHSKASDIAEVSIEYPKQQGKSFRLNVNNGDPEVTPFYPLSSTIDKPLRPGAVEAYLDKFSRVDAASFNNLNRDREAISQQVPFAIVSVKENDGTAYSIKLFPMNVDDAYDPKTGTTTVIDETTAFYALTENNDFMITQNVVLRKILWGYEFFY